LRAGRNPRNVAGVIRHRRLLADGRTRPAAALRLQMRSLPTILLVLLLPHLAAAQQRPAETGARADSVLQSTLERLVRGFGGEVGVYVRHLRTGATAAIRADEVFPTASLVKVPLLLSLYDQVERGRLDLAAEVAYPDTLTYAYGASSDVVRHMKPGQTLPLSQLAFLMVSVSDNFASLWIQALVGGGAEVNRWLEANGFERTRVNSRTPGREALRTEHGWGQTTPREMSEALVLIRDGRAVSPRASEAMYRMLSGSYWHGDGLSQIPPTVEALSKQGAVDRSRSETLLVNSPSGDYVLTVITRNQTDTRYEPDNEGQQLIRVISRAVYEHFNPGDPWRPAP
jgi:beta-lactamase class A